MRILRAFPVLLLTLGVAACEMENGEVETADETMPAAESGMEMDRSAMEAQIQDIRQRWIQAAEADQPNQIAALYAEDAVMVGPMGERLEGRSAIQESLTGAFAELADMEVHSIATEISSDGLIADMGTYTQTFETAEGGERVVEGYYTVLARHQDDGTVRILHHLAAPSPDSEWPAPADTTTDATPPADTTGDDTTPDDPM